MADTVTGQLVLKKGDIFHGYRIIERLDHGRKGFREVWHCVKTNRPASEAALILYHLIYVPFSILDRNSKSYVPVEYEYYIRNSKDDSGAMMKLYDHGTNGSVCWLITEYDPAIKTHQELIAGRDYNSEDARRTYLDILVALEKLCRIILRLGFKRPIIGTTGSVCFKRLNNGKLMARLINIDEALYPCYDMDETMYFFDPRFVAQEVTSGIIDERTVSYSLAMVALDAYGCGLPPARSDFGNHTPLFEVTERCVPEYGDMVSRGIPEKLCQLFESCLNPFHKNRKVLKSALDLLAKNDDEDGCPQEMNPFQAAMMQMMQEEQKNPFSDRFVEAKGSGLMSVIGMDDLKQRIVMDILNPYWNRTHTEKARETSLQNDTKKRRNGIILVGPPGAGKTYIANAIAQSLGAYSYAPTTQDFGSSGYSESEIKIGQLFEAAFELADKLEAENPSNPKPVVIILNEVDNSCQTRNVTLSPGAAGTCTAFLHELEKCKDHNVLVIGTANDITNMDDATTRDGRLGKKYFVAMPDRTTKSRMLIKTLRHYPNNLSEADCSAIASGMDCYTLGDIQQLIEGIHNEHEMKNRNRIYRSFVDPKSGYLNEKDREDYSKALLENCLDDREYYFMEWLRLEDRADLMESYKQFKAHTEGQETLITKEEIRICMNVFVPSLTKDSVAKYESQCEGFLPKRREESANAAEQTVPLIPWLPAKGNDNKS